MDINDTPSPTLQDSEASNEETSPSLLSKLMLVTLQSSRQPFLLQNGFKITYANEAASQMFGYPLHELIGMDSRDLTVPDERDRITQYSYARRLKEGPPPPNQYRIQFVRKNRSIGTTSVMVMMNSFDPNDNNTILAFFEQDLESPMTDFINQTSKFLTSSRNDVIDQRLAVNPDYNLLRNDTKELYRLINNGIKDRLIALEFTLKSFDQWKEDFLGEQEKERKNAEEKSKNIRKQIIALLVGLLIAAGGAYFTKVFDTDKSSKTLNSVIVPSPLPIPVVPPSVPVPSILTNEPKINNASPN